MQEKRREREREGAMRAERPPPPCSHLPRMLSVQENSSNLATNDYGNGRRKKNGYAHVLVTTLSERDACEVTYNSYHALNKPFPSLQSKPCKPFCTAR